MKYFSVIEFGEEMFVAPGKVDNLYLSKFDPLLELLTTLETSEEVLVHCSYGLLQAEGADTDIPEDEIGDLIDNFGAIVAEKKIEFLETYNYELEGVLEEPFEDIYQLEGKEREEFLATKKAFFESQAALRAALAEEEAAAENIL